MSSGNSVAPRESLQSLYRRMKEAEREWQGWLRAPEETTEAEIAEAKFDMLLEEYQEALSDAQESAGYDPHDWGSS